MTAPISITEQMLRRRPVIGAPVAHGASENLKRSIGVFQLTMFGVGCTTIWFALSHVEIVSTEEKLESITTRLDKIIEKIERQ